MKRKDFIKRTTLGLTGLSHLGGLYSWQVRFNVRPEITIFKLATA